MIYQELSRWISQSESWQAFVDLKIPEESRARYVFLDRPDDFYISLLSQLQDVLDLFYAGESEEIKNDLLAIAKGLEIYSLNRKRDSFAGINHARNMLYVAALYYLADYAATSFLLLKLFSSDDFETDIERFVYYFLSKNFSRKEAQNNVYFNNILVYLRDGDIEQLRELSDTFSKILTSDNQIESHLFVLVYISRSLLMKFQTNNLWHDLREHGPGVDWKSFIRFNIGKAPQIWSFFPSQQVAIRSGLLTFEKAFSLQTPTSSGKTSIAELVIFNELFRDPSAKILYLAPFRALAAELKNNLGRNLSSKLGIKIKTIYGGNIVTDSDKIRIEQSNVVISTPEKFMAIELGLSGLLDDFKTVICDEGHLIDNPTRGISYELLLSRLKNNSNVDRRFLFLSAIIPNIEVINSWLGGGDSDIAKSGYRPTQIELGYLRAINNYEFSLEINPNERAPRKYVLNHFITKNDLAVNSGFYKLTTFKAKTVATALKSLNSGAVAIFTPTKSGNQGASAIANEVIAQIAASLPKPIGFCNTDELLNLIEYFKYIFGQDFLLVKCLEQGFLFHHGDLPQFVRELVEDYVRTEKIKLIICTSTLSEGVNLPIKTLVINTVRRYNPDSNKMELLPKRDIKNLIGRAGRAGKETKGVVVVVNPADQSVLLEVMADRNMEEVRGFLFYVTRAIERFITTRGLSLSNELLDQLEQSDYIDNSIIQLLAEDISDEGLKDAVDTLVKNTLTFYQGDEQMKDRLKELFELRSEKIKPIIQNRNIAIIRYSGIPLRAFDQVMNTVDFEVDFLDEISDPLDERWLSYLFDILFNISIGKSISDSYPRDVLVAGLSTWIKGGWYHDVAEALNDDVEEALRFVKFLEFKLQNAASSVIKFIEMKRAESDLAVSRIVLQWSNFVVYGVSNIVELDLIEIGLTDRVLVYHVSRWIIDNERYYIDQDDLRSLLLAREVPIVEYLEDRIPMLSMAIMNDYFYRNSEF